TPSTVALKAKFNTASDRLEVFLDAYANPDKLRASVAKATSSKLEELLQIFVTSFETFCETFPASPDNSLPDEISSASKRSADLMARSDRLSITLESIFLENSSQIAVPTNKTEKSNKLPKVELRSFDEVNPEIWFDQLALQMRAAKITDEHHQFATLTRFLDSNQSLFISPVLKSNESSPYSAAKKLLLQQYSLSKIQRLRKAIFDEKRGSEEKTSHLLSRLEPLLKDTGIDELKKFLLLSSLPDTVKEHVATKFDSASVSDFSKECDALLDIRQNKEAGTVSVSTVWNTKNIGKNSKRGKRSDNSKNRRPCTSHLAYGSQARTCRGPSCPNWSEDLQQ
ncbi:Hypothetical predicted protein, partial [Paramuricea clavata]